MGLCFCAPPSLHSASQNRPHYPGASGIHGSNVEFSETTTTTEIRKRQFSVGETTYIGYSPVTFTHGQIRQWPELKVFSFEELKSATGNFMSDRLVGEGEFSRDYKGRLEEHTLNPATPGSGV